MQHQGEVQTCAYQTSIYHTLRTAYGYIVDPHIPLYQPAWAQAASGQCCPQAGEVLHQLERTEQAESPSYLDGEYRDVWKHFT